MRLLCQSFEQMLNLNRSKSQELHHNAQGQFLLIFQ